ncbi:MAG: putative membrane protein [Marivirga sp.]|jgi:putative membrane protein
MKKIVIPKIVPDYQNDAPIILRDFLALERTKLANERTLFSYIRTSLYLFIGGIGLLQLRNFEQLIWLAYSSVVISMFLLSFGLLRYIRFNKKLQKFYQTDTTNKTKDTLTES